MSAPLQPLGAAGPPESVDAFVRRMGLWDPPAAGDGGGVRLIVGMIGSTDGHATVEGRAGGLSDAVDRQLLRTMRAPVDAMLVGAGTLIGEGYVNLMDAQHRAARIERGMPPAPLLATISRRLDPRLAQVPLFAEAGQRILVLTESDAAVAGRGADVEVERFAPGTLTARACLQRLKARGADTVLSEGGPTLLHELLRERLVDELVLTLSPKVVAGDGLSVVNGAVFDPPLELRLQDVSRAGDLLVLRYVPQR